MSRRLDVRLELKIDKKTDEKLSALSKNSRDSKSELVRQMINTSLTSELGFNSKDSHDTGR